MSKKEQDSGIVVLTTIVVGGIILFINWILGRLR